MGKKKKKASGTQETGKFGGFSFQPLTVSTQQLCDHSSSALWTVSVIASDLGTCTGESRKPGTQLLCARPLKAGDCPVSLIITLEDCQEQKQPRFRSMGSSCCHLTLRMTTACGERQLKQRKKTEGLCKVRFVTSSMFLSLSRVQSFHCLLSPAVLLCAEPGRTLTQSSKSRSCSNGVKY